ncbi:MAG: hypothetical protein JKY65_28635 [Planctomycetes bacterium]|nr:hypothetical protein [Planctomycetota bacterium]
MSLRTLLLLPALTLTLLGCPSGGSTADPAKSKTAKTAKTTKTKKAPKKPKKPFDRKTLTTPWKDAKVGQFAVYNAVQMGGKIRFEVTKVEDQTVTFKVIRGSNESSQTVDLADKEERFKDPTAAIGVQKDKIETKAMKVGDGEISVQVIKREMKGSGATENWLTTVVPPFMEALDGNATAKSFKDGAMLFELVEFGSK